MDASKAGGEVGNYEWPESIFEYRFWCKGLHHLPVHQETPAKRHADDEIKVVRTDLVGIGTAAGKYCGSRCEAGLILV